MKTNNHEKFMARALELARQAQGNTSPNPMVGCVIVKKGQIIAEGFHRKCGSDHAEVAALKKVPVNANRATMYVTLEPCHHTGRTPPCVDTIIAHGISEVIIGMQDPNPFTNGKSIQKLKFAGIKVECGILEKECQQLNEAFIKFIQTGMPFVVSKTAQTLDGKIATATGQSKWITSEAMRKFSRKKRDEFDAILVGSETVLHDDPKLTASKKSKRLKKIVVDSSLKTALTAEWLKGKYPEDCIVAVTQKASAKKIKAFEGKGYQVIICPEKKGHINLKWLFKQLARNDIMSILIEGGAHVIGTALKDKLVDQMHIYIAPKIIGDQKALSAVQNLGIKNLEQAVQLQDVTYEIFKEGIMVNGYVLRNC